MRGKCSVPGCDAKDQKRFFGVPNIEKESARRQIWIQLLHLDPKKFKTSTKICAKHFDESDILPNRLKQGTNPTRNFPVSIPKPFFKSTGIIGVHASRLSRLLSQAGALF